MKLSSETLRRRLSESQWTSHNIRLDTEVTTIPGAPDFLESDGRLRAILRVLDTLYEGGLSGLRIADLGSLEGGYALALARRGARVLGIEARASNFAKLALIQEHFELPNLAFVRGDVKDFRLESYGEFDAVLALGILYHLDQPAKWLSQIAPAVKKVLVVDSHYAPADDQGLHLLHSSFAQLGPLERIESDGWTCQGRWFPEFPEGTDLETQPWASYSNPRSFWMTKESLLFALRRAGFSILLEQHDANLDHYGVFSTECPRAMFVALKPPNTRAA